MPTDGRRAGSGDRRHRLADDRVLFRLGHTWPGVPRAGEHTFLAILACRATPRPLSNMHLVCEVGRDAGIEVAAAGCFAHPFQITLPELHSCARRLPRLAFGLPLSYHIRALAGGARITSRAF
jgi:hypothetical protein